MIKINSIWSQYSQLGGVDDNGKQDGEDDFRFCYFVFGYYVDVLLEGEIKVQVDDGVFGGE